MASASKKFLTLKQFMVRQEVLKLYREILRTARKTDSVQRQEIFQWARADFKNNANVTDPTTIQSLLNNGRRLLTELQNTIKKTS